MSPCALSWHSLFLVLTLFIAVIFRNASAGPAYVYSLCSGIPTVAPNSQYQTNLDILLSFLSAQITHNNDFHNATVGSGANKVYGILYCGYTDTAPACKECICLARKDIRISCSGQKAAIIWYDLCLIRYSNESFVGTMNASPMIPLWNRQTTVEIWDVTKNQAAFMQVLYDTLGEVAVEAAKNLSGHKFATKEASFSSNLTTLSTLYTLGKCLADVSSTDCHSCLRILISNISQLCNGMAGCAVLCPSCYIRYNTHPFWGNVAETTAVASPGPLLTGASRRKREPLVVGSSTSAAVVLVFFGVCCLICKRKSKGMVPGITTLKSAPEIGGIELVESLKFEFNTIRKATDNFSEDIVLGEGGFGRVYKGRLEDGQDIAIKRLSRTSKQGIAEFKTEVLLVAKLQHRNLVKILGFCLEGEEKILVYEFLQNLSLDRFLSDPVKRTELNWNTRFKIICGIAKGLLYLHEDSRLKVVHRDLKSINILLDEDMNPKIADFGMAKLFGVDQTQDNTNRIVGTMGYMAPEYVLLGHFSAKSDVYSFGIIILEIVSGRKMSHINEEQNNEPLLYQAWRLWKEGMPLKLADSTFGDIYPTEEVSKCIHIGLLCVQEHAAKRPQMTSIVAMLNGESISLPLPRPPHFLTYRGEESSLDQCVRMSIVVDSITELCPR